QACPGCFRSGGCTPRYRPLQAPAGDKYLRTLELDFCRCRAQLLRRKKEPLFAQENFATFCTLPKLDAKRLSREVEHKLLHKKSRPQFARKALFVAFACTGCSFGVAPA